MAVFLLLALAWVVVLVPPALRAQAARQEAFLASLGDQGSAPAAPVRARGTRSEAVQCRRRIAGGLLMAMAVTLGAGLLPTFNVLLYVHLFLVDSFLAYIALLAHQANRAGRPALSPPLEPVAEPEPEPAPRRRVRRTVPVPVFPELGPVA